MEVINNRYRIVKLLNRNRVYISYLVYDLKAKYKVKKLNIINEKKIPNALIDYYKNDFITLTNINNKNIDNLYNFGIVDLVDNKKLNYERYFYTCDYFDSNIDFKQFILQIKNEDNILNLFMDVCEAFNHIHSKGLTYDELNLDNICIKIEEKNFKTRLKDLVTIQLDKYRKYSLDEQVIIFKDPKSIVERKSDVLYDIYSLGILLFFLCSQNIDFYKTLNHNEHFKDILNSKSILHRMKRELSYDYKMKIIHVINKCIDSNLNNRYKYVNSIVKDINKLFNKTYSCSSVGVSNKINYNLKLIGRNEELDKVMNEYELMQSHSENNKIVFIHGETGIGKTKFLTTVRYLLMYKNSNVYCNFLKNEQSNSLFISIIKQMLYECDNQIIEKYKKQLDELIEYSKDEKKLISLYENKKNRLKLLNVMHGFINDFIKYNPIVVILDDIHLADDFSVDLLEYLCLKGIKNKGIFLILSYCEGEHILNKRVSKLIDKVKFNNNVVNIYLKGLSEVYTQELVKSVLSMRKAPVKLSNLIYKRSYGNPLFTIEIIKDLINKNIIYVNEETGEWYTHLSYEQFPIPNDMNQILLNSIKDIDSTSYDVLSSISIFLNPVSIEMISYINNEYTKEEIEKHVNILMNKGILCKKIGDEGFVYDFYNKILKRVIYEQIDSQKRKYNHNLVINYLEKSYLEGKISYIEEIIYQLERSNQKLKLIKYYKSNAKRMKKLNNYMEAKNNIKKAIEVIEDTNLYYKQIIFYMEMANINKTLGDFDGALKFYKKTIEKCEKENLNKLKIDCLNNIASIYYEKNNIEKSKLYLNKVEDILSTTKYLKGYLIYQNTFARILTSQEKYEEACDVCKKALKMNKGVYKKCQGVLCNTLGNIYIMISEIKKAALIYERNVKLFEKIKYYEGLTAALNNLGVIYADFYQEQDKALKYFIDMKNICKENNLILNEITATSNIGEILFYSFDFTSALKNFSESENKAEKYDYEAAKFYVYIFLCNIYLAIGNLKDAYKYYCLCNDELIKYPFQGKYIGEYYNVCTKFNLEFMNIKKACEFAKKSYKLYKNDCSISKLNSEFLLKYTEIYEKGKLSGICSKLIDEAMSIIDKVHRLTQKVYYLYLLSEVCYYVNQYDKGRSILKYLNTCKNDIKNLNYMNINIRYINALYDEENKIYKLNELLYDLKLNKNKKLLLNVYSEMAQNYILREDYFNAFVYYTEYFTLILDIVKQLPEVYGDFLINSNKFKQALSNFEKICKLYNIDDSYFHIYDKNDLKLIDLKQIIELINSDKIRSNRTFRKFIYDFYNLNFDNKVSNTEELLRNLTSDNLYNLRLILNFLIYVLMGTNGCITDNKENNYKKIVCINEEKELTDEEMKIIEQCSLEEKPYLMKKEDYKLDSFRACMCMPIILNKHEISFKNNRRKNNNLSRNKILGYILIKSQNALNNFNEASLEKCTELSNLIAIIIEKYKLSIIASQDKLTGTLTRKYLEEAIENSIEICTEENRIFSMIMFDLDHFKIVNDKFGHQTGDMVLKRVCEIVSNNIRKGDICGRYGGEEFIIVLKDASSKQALKIAEKLRKSIEDAKILGDKMPITVSMGVASYPKHAQWKRQLIEKVDQAVYMAKESGRNTCKLWNQNFSTKVSGGNKLTGIITGNEVQNNRNVLVMVELIDIINQNISLEDKIYKILGRIIEITESEFGTLFLIEGEHITKNYTRRNFEEGWKDYKGFNYEIISSVIDKKQGVYMIDWDNLVNDQDIIDSPDWYSIIAVPLINKDILKGILYLSSKIKTKEFDFNDFNFVNTLSKIISTGI